MEEVIKKAIKLNRINYKENKFLRKFTLYRLKNYVIGFIRYVLIYGLCFLILYPLFSKFCIVFMEERDMYDFTVNYIPKHFTLDNFKLTWQLMNYPKAFINTIIYLLCTSVLQVGACTVVAYGFARFEFPLKKLWFGAVLLMLLLPPQIIYSSMFLHFRYFDVFGIVKLLTGTQGINLLNKQFLPYILVSITAVGLKNALYILIIRQQFKGMSKTLEEAAYIDGLGPFRTFYKIMLPNAKPICITALLFSISWQWTDEFYPSFFKNRLFLMVNSINGIFTEYERMLFEKFGLHGHNAIAPHYKLQLQYAGILLMIIPLIIVFIFAQRYFVESIERSGMVE